MSKPFKIIILAIISFFWFNFIVGQGIPNMNNLTLKYDSCESYNDPIFDDPAMLIRFEQVMLGRSLKEVENLGPKEQEELFKYLYSRKSICQYELGLNDYRIYPNDPLCELLRKFVAAQEGKNVLKEIMEKELTSDFDSSSFTLVLEYRSYFDTYQLLKIREIDENAAQYSFRNSPMLASEDQIVRTEGKIENWPALKKQILELNLDEIGLYDEQYEYRLTVDGDSHNVRINHKGAVIYFSFPHIFMNCFLKPCDTVKEMLKIFDRSLSVKFKHCKPKK